VNTNIGDSLLRDPSLNSRPDEVLTIPKRSGRGFVLNLTEHERTPNTALFGHPGMGDSIGLIFQTLQD
jgi:hypothetical protein